MESLFSPAGPSSRSTSPPNAPTTDFDVIEAQKENIRPTPSGRSAATLSTLLDKASLVDQKVQEGHERYRRQIAEAERREREGEDMEDGILDVLDIHNRYVAFNVEHHPTSSNHLIPLLESTTRKFVADDRYKQDLRHLKLWIQFSRLIERREEVWAFLDSRDIGTKHSLLYEEWAMTLESLGRKKKADEIFKLGIARKAQPLEKLKSRHSAFLERIMALNGQIPDDEPNSTSDRTPGRAILGQTTSGATSSSIAGATQLAPSLRGAGSTKNNGSKIAIFSDGAGRGIGEAGENSEWAEFGTRDGRRKENVIEATPWKGETMPQSAAKLRIAPRTPKIEVFKEVTDIDNTAIRPADNIFSRARQPPTEAELIKSDPLRYYDLTAPTSSTPATASLPPPPSARKPPRPKTTGTSGWRPTKWEFPTEGPETKDSKGRVKERRVFPWDEVFRHDEEWSFEEVRARQRGLLGKEWRGEVQDWERTWHAPGSSTPKKEEKKVKVRPPSPTVNTKLANREIAAMFDQTIHGGKMRDSDSESSDEDSDEDEEAVPVAVAATPLPAARPVTTMAMPTPSYSAVPPTPTPASSGSGNGRLNIFADENNVPTSAVKPTPARLNIFAEAPARTPLVSRSERSEGGESSSKSRAFGIFSEETPSAPLATPLANRRPLAGGNPFATPAPALGQSGPARRVLANSIPEETAEAEEDVPVVASGMGSDELAAVAEETGGVEEYEDEEEEEMPRRRLNGWQPTMTPITERTCEFTTHTQFTSRSSLSGSQLGQSVRRNSIRPETPINEDEEEENAFDRDVAMLSKVEEVDEQPRPSLSSGGSFEGAGMFVDTTSPLRSEFDRSGSVDPPFSMPEGFTIHGGGVVDRSMAIIDRPTTQRFSLEQTKVEKVEETDAEETGQFVTATAGTRPVVDDALPNPCNPTDEHILQTLLSRIDPPLEALPGFIDLRSETCGRLPALQKHSKAKVRRASQTSRTSAGAGADDPYELQLAGREFEAVDKIGEGGFGAVFLAVDLAKREEADEKSDTDEADEDFMVAIKVESPATVWEAVVVDRIHRRLDPVTATSIVRTKELYAYQDESYLLLEYSSQGTLLDLVNKSTQLSIAPAPAGSSPAVDELLAIFFTVEILRIVENLHSGGFIHGDLKIDNCLVRLDPTPSTITWSNQYSGTGSDGWKSKGVKLIDFGRAVDMTLFPAGEQQEFIADWPHDERDCLEMREGKAWSYQTDYAGLASVAYCLLFGKYIQTEVVEVEGKRKCRITTSLKRYWQTELWNELFDTLLNPKSVRSDCSLPITTELGQIRAKFEGWLEENCQKNGKNLKQMLKKVETAAMMSKRF